MARKSPYRAVAKIDPDALASFQAGIRKRYSNDQILAELRRAAGTQFCPRCVGALERILPLETVESDADRAPVVSVA